MARVIILVVAKNMANLVKNKATWQQSILSSNPPKFKLIIPFAFFKNSIIFPYRLPQQPINFLLLSIKVSLTRKDLRDRGSFLFIFKGVVADTISPLHISSMESKLFAVFLFLEFLRFIALKLNGIGINALFTFRNIFGVRVG